MNLSYSTKKGDSFWGISEHYINDSNNINDLILEWKKISSEILIDYGVEKIDTKQWIILVSSKDKQIISPEWVFFDSINTNTDIPVLISRLKNGKFILLSAITWKSILEKKESYNKITYAYNGILCESNNGIIKILDDFWNELFAYQTNNNTKLLNKNIDFEKIWLFHILENGNSKLLDKKWNVIDSVKSEFWMHYFDKNKNCFYRYIKVKKYFWLITKNEKYYID